MLLKMKYFGALAGCALATGSLCAATYSESFESGTAGQAFASWDGGTVTNNGDYAYLAIAGYPMDANHTKVLLVEGDTSYDASEGSYTGTPLVDMMVQASRPDEDLDLPEGETGVHVAVAVDSNGFFNVYCNSKSDEPGWYKLSDKAYADGEWARVSLLFNYTAGRCQVRIDGEPMMTTNGYLTVASTEGSSAENKGGWYKIANEGSAVSSLKVVGCTAIDDVVISANDSSYEYAVDSSAETNGVSCAWLDKYGLGWNTTGNSYDESGMTVAQKYNACLEPLDGQTFEVKSVTADTENNVTVVGIPATVDTVGRKVVLQSSTDSSFPNTDATTTTDVAPGQTEVEVALPAAGSVKYFRLRAMDK